MSIKFSQGKPNSDLTEADLVSKATADNSDRRTSMAASLESSNSKKVTDESQMAESLFTDDGSSEAYIQSFRGDEKRYKVYKDWLSEVDFNGKFVQITEEKDDFAKVGEFKSKKTIVLDLDETLVHT
jgi:predicted enzyme involved in methoxymalonyl-ACP biosynthesis